MGEFYFIDYFNHWRIAVSYRKGWFRGHKAKPFFSINGVSEFVRRLSVANNPQHLNRSYLPLSLEKLEGQGI